MEELMKYAEGISQEQSIYFLAFLGGAFLIGFILAWIIWGSRARKFRKQLTGQSSQGEENNTEISRLKTSLGEREQLIEEMDAELKKLKNTPSSNVQDRAIIEALKRDNKNLLSQIASYKSTIAELQRAKEAELSEENETDLSETLTNRLDNIERKLSALSVKKTNAGTLIQSNPTVEVKDDSESMRAEQEAKNLIEAKMGTMIPVATFEQRDDLKLINGIGPFLEKQLNETGFFTYDQIASMDEETGRALAIAIGFLPDRVEKDAWVRQARHFNVLKAEDPKALKRIAEYPTDTTDLQIFKGIGSREEDTLKANGFHNWDDMAKAGFEDINRILGNMLESKYTSTLSQQAQMAIEGKWEKLKAFQDFLN